MNGAAIVTALERFFLDIVGTCVPGGALLLGLRAVAGWSLRIGDLTVSRPNSAPGWVFFVAAAYVAGHLVTSLGEHWVLPRLETLASAKSKWAKSQRKLSQWFGRRVPTFLISNNELCERISGTFGYKMVVRTCSEAYSWSEPQLGSDYISPVRRWRSVALTIAHEQNQTVYRFTFLALLNLGIATVLFLLALIWLGLWELDRFGYSSAVREMSVPGIVLMLLMVVPFLERRYAFYGMSMRVPFDMAVVKLKNWGK